MADNNKSLDDIFDTQTKFQQLLGLDIHDEAFQLNMLYATVSEIVEAGNEIAAFKLWKKEQRINREAFLYELVDVVLFTVNLALSVDCSGEEFFECIRAKQRLNYARKGFKPYNK